LGIAGLGAARHTNRMRIVVTGAAGRIGSVIARHLASLGHAVIALDQRGEPAADPRVRAHDLLDAPATTALFAETRAEALVHFANHPSSYSAPQGVVYRENVAMTWNTFEAAFTHGATRCVYASSLQAITGGPRDALPYDDLLPAFPVPADGTEPANPGNAYGLTKVIGEETLALWCKRDGVSGVSLRLPMVVPAGATLPSWLTARDWSRPQPEFCGWLTAESVAALVAAILVADLPGHRIYTPSGPLAPGAPPLADLLAGPFAGVVRRRPVEEIAQPFDTRRITAETGWIPPAFPVSATA
jgi:nucleoside-diphosphate-sugar epimerase